MGFSWNKKIHISIKEKIPLYIESFINQGYNIAENCFKFYVIKEHFASMYNKLQNAIKRNNYSVIKSLEFPNQI